MKDVEIIGMLKSYVKKSLVGMGALKGAPCTIKSITYDEENKLNTVVFEWEDTEGIKHTSTMLVYDGTDGFSPEITIKSSTSTEYILTIKTKEGSFDTPNLKGSGGGGGASALSDLSDVILADLADGDILIYDQTQSKWKNVSDAIIDDIKVNGVAQTITAGAVDLDVASNLITETQWTEIQTILS